MTIVSVSLPFLNRNLVNSGNLSGLVTEFSPKYYYNSSNNDHNINKNLLANLLTQLCCVICIYYHFYLHLLIHLNSLIYQNTRRTPVETWSSSLSSQHFFWLLVPSGVSLWQWPKLQYSSTVLIHCASLICSSTLLTHLRNFCSQREIFPPDEKIQVSIPPLILSQLRWSQNQCTVGIIHLIIIFLTQRQKLEEFKERMRARREQKVLKQLGMDSEKPLE